MIIADLLSSPEGKTLEFKRDLSTPTPILKTLVVTLPEILPLTREQSRSTLPTRDQSGAQSEAQSGLESGAESGLESLASRILAVLGNTGAFFLPPSYLIL